MLWRNFDHDDTNLGIFLLHGLIFIKLCYGVILTTTLVALSDSLELSAHINSALEQAKALVDQPRMSVQKPLSTVAGTTTISTVA